jgi:hypothetical protein
MDQRRTIMPVPDHQSPARFTLDASRLGNYLLEEHDERLGLDEFHEPGGLSGCIRDRISDANDAAAILGPDGYEVAVHACHDGDLIVTVNKDSTWAARAPIHSKRLPNTGDRSFDGCCATLQWLLDQATPLIAQVDRALDTTLADASANPGDSRLLTRVAKELLLETLEEERDDQPADIRIADGEFAAHLQLLSELLGASLAETVAGFMLERTPLPQRKIGGGRP